MKPQLKGISGVRFTLVELLVTIAIIAMLASILLPSLAKAKGNAQKINCSGNMKQLGSGLFMYSGDFNGFLPSSSMSLTQFWNGAATWQMNLVPYLGINLSAGGWAPARLKSFSCPSDRTEPLQWLIDNDHWSKISYCSNLQVMDWLCADGDADGFQSGSSLSQIPKPSRTIMLAENHASGNGMRFSAENGKCWNSGYTYEYTVQNSDKSNDEGKRGYHSSFNNWLFCDGHMENMSWEKTIYGGENLWVRLK